MNVTSYCRRCLFSSPYPDAVISTEAAGSFIVRCIAARPLYFVRSGTHLINREGAQVTYAKHFFPVGKYLSLHINQSPLKATLLPSPKHINSNKSLAFSNLQNYMQIFAIWHANCLHPKYSRLA